MSPKTALPRCLPERRAALCCGFMLRRLHSYPAVLFLTLACASTPDSSQQRSAAAPAFVRPCAMSAEHEVPHGVQRVFVEIGASEERGVPIQTPPQGPAQAWSVAHLLATNGQTATIPWRFDRGGIGEASVGELTVLPRFSDVAPGHVRLTLGLHETVDDPTTLEAEPHTRAAAVETSLVLADQQTIVVKTAPRGSMPSQTFLVTPYFIRNETDLRALFQCKLRARAVAERVP